MFLCDVTAGGDGLAGVFVVAAAPNENSLLLLSCLVVNVDVVVVSVRLRVDGIVAVLGCKAVLMSMIRLSSSSSSTPTASGLAISAAFDLIFDSLEPASGIELLRSSGISLGIKTGGASFVGLSGGCGITAAASILLITGSAMSVLDGDEGVIKLSLLLLELKEGD